MDLSIYCFLMLKKDILGRLYATKNTGFFIYQLSKCIHSLSISSRRVIVLIYSLRKIEVENACYSKGCVYWLKRAFSEIE